MSHLVNVDELDIYIANLVENGSTRCGHSQDYLSECLSNYTPGCGTDNGWDMFIVEYPINSTIDHMEQLLTKYGYITVIIDYYDSGVSVDHAITLCLTKDGLQVVDSYIRTRTCSRRMFDMELLRKFILAPSLEEWNKMWLCSEKCDTRYYDRYVKLEYLSYDSNRVGKTYRNSVEI